VLRHSLLSRVRNPCPPLTVLYMKEVCSNCKTLSLNFSLNVLAEKLYSGWRRMHRSLCLVYSTELHTHTHTRTYTEVFTHAQVTYRERIQTCKTCLSLRDILYHPTESNSNSSLSFQKPYLYRERERLPPVIHKRGTKLSTTSTSSVRSSIRFIFWRSFLTLTHTNQLQTPSSFPVTYG